MAQAVDMVSSGFAQTASHPVVWAGRSGRRYVMQRIAEGSPTMSATLLYVLAVDGIVRWVGMAQELIVDQASRARFRRASDDGAQMFALAAPKDEIGQMTLAWDLDGTHHLEGRSAA
jgi:hypothetical protein